MIVVLSVTVSYFTKTFSNHTEWFAQLVLFGFW